MTVMYPLPFVLRDPHREIVTYYYNDIHDSIVLIRLLPPDRILESKFREGEQTNCWTLN